MPSLTNRYTSRSAASRLVGERSRVNPSTVAVMPATAAGHDLLLVNGQQIEGEDHRQEGRPRGPERLRAKSVRSQVVLQLLDALLAPRTPVVIAPQHPRILGAGWSPRCETCSRAPPADAGPPRPWSRAPVPAAPRSAAPGPSPAVWPETPRPRSARPRASRWRLPAPRV